MLGEREVSLESESLGSRSFPLALMPQSKGGERSAIMTFVMKMGVN